MKELNLSPVFLNHDQQFERSLKKLSSTIKEKKMKEQVQRFRTSDNLEQFAEALALAQGVMKPAEKDKINSHFRSSYASLESVMAACRIPLSQNGIAIVQIPFSGDGKAGVVTRLIHKSGQWIECELEGPIGKDSFHGIGSALTYAKRFTLTSLTGVVDGDGDDDGNEVSISREDLKPTTLKAIQPRLTEALDAPLLDIFNPRDPEHLKRFHEYIDKKNILDGETRKKIGSSLSGKRWEQFDKICAEILDNVIPF